MAIIIDHSGKVDKNGSLKAVTKAATWGTNLQGDLFTDYENIVSVFGKQNEFPLGVEWTIFTPHGVALIMNLDRDIRPPEKIDIWHLAAHSIEPYDWIKDVIT